MTELTLDPDLENDDIGLQVREMETDDLLGLYRLLSSGPTVFQYVADELTHRYDHPEELEAEGLAEEIEETVGMW